MSNFIVSDIRDATSAIKSVLTKADEVFSLYCFEDGQVKAMNRNMSAGIPVMFDEDMVLAAGDLDRALKVLRSDPEVLIGPSNIVFKSGKTRITLPRLEASFEIKVEDIEGDEVELDEDFVKQLKAVTPLLEDATVTDWMNSVICINGKLITTRKGQFMLAADYQPFADEEVKCLLPMDIVKFLISKREWPSEMIVNKNAAMFKYDDDSWVKSALFTGKVPGKLFTLLDAEPSNAWVPSEEHKTVIKDCLSLGAARMITDGKTITAEMVGNSGGNVVFDIDFPVPEGRKKRWNTKDLDLAFAVGEKFDFVSDDTKAIFTGPNLHGLIAPMLA